MKQRVLFFDIARALCILWIVGFWHVIDYLHSEELAASMKNYSLVTQVALCCFTFISGFFLGKKRVSAGDFYKKRLKRFFVPLLVTSAMLSVFGWFDSPLHFVLSVTGLASFIGRMPTTLWYFSMLMIFYLLTPPLLYKAEGRPVDIIARALLVFAVFYVLHNVGYCDKRLLLYFPYYIAGMCLTMDNVISLVSNKVYFTLAMCVAVLSFCIPSSYALNGGGKILLGVYLLITITYYMEKYLHPAVNRIFSMIAYASMFAYLFHREGYGIYQLYERVTSVELPQILLPMLTVIIFVVSYYMQMLYDRLLNKIERKSD